RRDASFVGAARAGVTRDSANTSNGGATRRSMSPVFATCAPSQRSCSVGHLAPEPVDSRPRLVCGGTQIVSPAGPSNLRAIVRGDMDCDAFRASEIDALYGELDPA